ncbi:hypothetical protein EDC30_101257 [Paucimonas lemoignei]|uniref:Uncharacterized protein n=1 Tax=Paucimonas lemoignei TaxID=29443 RepID=A0A4R3I3B4_PAULE|nr:hypothetical protein [Paucimonas lemoignei]TCS39301.1 hypothetical protein EDC30_101257 [Paucimonas lemoignei]
MNKLTTFFVVLAFLAADLRAAPPQSGMTGRPNRSRQANDDVQHISINLVEFDKHVARAAENLKHMQRQMEAIQKTRDAQERLRILDQHWLSLQASLENLRDLWGPGLLGCCGASPPAEERMSARLMGGPMMGGMMSWQSTGTYYSSLTLEQLKQRHYMSDQYLAMQYQVMNHMLLHQQWVQQLQSHNPARAR